MPKKERSGVSGALCVAAAGWLAGWLTGSTADESPVSSFL